MADIHDLVPAYVNDDLSDSDLHAFKSHLPTCASCQADVSLLGGRKSKSRPGQIRFEQGSLLQFAALVLAAALVVVGLSLFLG